MIVLSQRNQHQVAEDEQDLFQNLAVRLILVIQMLVVQIQVLLLI